VTKHILFRAWDISATYHFGNCGFLGSTMALLSLLSVFWSLDKFRALTRFPAFRQKYGVLKALFLAVFASDAWRVQAELLISGRDGDAEAFRRTQENENHP
jgi:hypothetical protein